MPLAAYQAERRVFFKDTSNEFFVQGLSMESIAVLIREHLQDIDAIVDLFDNPDKIDDSAILSLAGVICSQAPGLAANLIALAAGEPDATVNAAKIPAPMQLEILVTVAHLTFDEVGGVKKSLGTIASLLKATGLNKKMLTTIGTRAA